MDARNITIIDKPIFKNFESVHIDNLLPAYEPIIPVNATINAGIMTISPL